MERLLCLWRQYRVPMILGGISVLCIIISLIFLVTSFQNVKPIEFGDSCEHVGEMSHNFDPLSQRLCETSRNGSDSLLRDGLDPALISINSSSQFELELLPGVGPATAKKIIDNRPYETIEELVVKKVMGEKLFEKVKNFLSL